MNLFPLEMPVDSFCMSRLLKNAEGGKVYVCTKGTPASEMTKAENFLTLYREEGGEQVSVSQPVILNQVGLPVVNGEVVSILCPQEYSLAVYDAYGEQQFYFPNVSNADPFKQELEDKFSKGLIPSIINYKYGLPREVEGSTLRILQSKIDESFVSVRDFGAKGDGVTDDTASFKAAITCGASRVLVPAGRYVITDAISLPSGVWLLGEGVDYWDTYRPDEGRLIKSWSKGTHLVFTGSGPKNKQFLNISNERPTKTINGVTCYFTDFTNSDAQSTTPATPRSLSVAVSVQSGGGLRDLRIMVSNEGISGYNDFVSTNKLGDNWDIGLHVYDSSDAVIDNVQVVGYWKVAGTLLTENDGSTTMHGNPERTLFNKFYTQGIRGLLIRNSPQVDVVSQESTTRLTIKANATSRILAQDGFLVAGSKIIYKWGSVTRQEDTYVLDGITPALPSASGVGVVRFPSIGNNWSGTVFNNAVAVSFEHSSGKTSRQLGLPVSFAMEIDGFPCRNLKFINFKAQTSYDEGNTLFGNISDAKFVASEFENGILIAYDLSQTKGYTGNMRSAVSDMQFNTTNIEGFTPRDFFYDLGHFPTSYTDGSFIMKHWRENDLQVQWYNGKSFIHLYEKDGRVTFTSKDGLALYNFSSTKDVTFKGRNFVFQNDASEDVLKWFGGSGNISTKGNISPMVDGSASLGTNSYRWGAVHSVNGSLQTSDGRLKDIYTIEQKELDAGLELSENLIKYRWKGEEKFHFGCIAQEVMLIMEKHGLDPLQYEMVQYDKEADIFSVNYGELSSFCIAALSRGLKAISQSS